MNMPPHEYEFDGQYGCKTCFSKMHCPQCNSGCGVQGHYVLDDDGGFFSCQNLERNVKRMTQLLKKLGR